MPPAHSDATAARNPPRARSLALARSPMEDDVEWYVRRREVLWDVCDGILETAPRRAIEETAEALGEEATEVWAFCSGDVITPVLDCCLHDWRAGGRSLVGKYAEETPPPEGTEERDALDALLRARYSVLKMEGRVPGVGMRATDMLTRDEAFLMEPVMSHFPGMEEWAIAGRIVPIGQFWMSTGAMLPMPAGEARRRIRQLKESNPAGIRDRNRLLDAPENIHALIRSWLEDHFEIAAFSALAGEAFVAGLERAADEETEHVDRDDDASLVEELPAPPAGGERPPARNAPCPCGSGRKHKRCCGRKQRVRAS